MNSERSDAAADGEIFELLVHSVKDYAIFMLDPGGHIATWNDGAERLKGYKAEEIIGQHFSVFYPEEKVAARFPDFELRVAADVGRFEDEGWRIRRDGSRFWANVVITALRGKNGELRGFGKVTRDLTKRRQAEEELRESEEKFRLLVDQVKDYAIFMLDTEGRIASWNLGAERLKGYRAEEVIGKHFSIFYPDDAAKAGKPEEEMRRAIVDGRVVDEGWRVRKNGTQFYAHVVLTAIRDADGKLKGFGKVTRDVTEFEAVRRQSERAAVFADDERLALLDTVLNQSPQGVIVCDSNGKLLIQNRAAERIWGGSATADDMSGWAKYRAFHPDGTLFKPEDWSMARALKHREIVPPEEYRIQRFDGNFAHILLSCAPILSVEGKLLGAVSVFADMTDLKRVEKERAELLVREQAARSRAEALQQRYEVTLKSIGDAVIATDASGAVTFLNPVAERMTGWKTEEAQGRPLNEVFKIVNEHTRAVVDNPVEKVLREGKTVGLANHTVLISRTGVEASIADSAAPIRDSSEALLGVVLVFRDVTEERAAEKALHETQERLREADRRKDEFLAMLAHELRNPLAPISTASHLLAARVGDREELRRPVGVLARQLQHLTKLVDDLLEVSRITRGKIRLDMEPLDMKTVVHRAVEISRPLIERKRHTLNVALPPEPVWVNGDATRLAQVVGNLLNNAAKYTEEGGKIDVALDRSGGEVVVSVKDTGIGIAPDLLPKLFQLFMQADTSLDRSQGGLGIGLTLARGLVELHQGTLEARSEGPGRGSEFTVRVPAVRPGTEKKEDGEAISLLSDIPATRIVIVDDNVDAAHTLSELLEDAGHEVKVAYDGLSGLELVRAVTPDVVLLDVGLPTMDGYDVARRLRQEHGRDLVLVALTGYGQPEDRRRSNSVGFDHHLLKPLDLRALAQALAQRPTRA